jgi:hypothetical protein
VRSPGVADSEVYSLFSCEATELVGKERAARFYNSTHSILILGFRECCADELLGNLLRNQPVEPSRVLIAAHIKHLENEAIDSNLFRGWQALVWRLRFRKRFFKPLTFNVLINSCSFWLVSPTG